MDALTCEYIVHPAFRDHYNFNDTDSLDAFHGWLGKRISDELLKKYGRRALDSIPQREIWLDDLGLVADCDFEDLADGSMRVTFSRVPYPQSGIRCDEGYVRLHSSTLGTQVFLADAYA
jgi:hypothetical protein